MSANWQIRQSSSSVGGASGSSLEHKNRQVSACVAAAAGLRLTTVSYQYIFSHVLQSIL